MLCVLLGLKGSLRLVRRGRALKVRGFVVGDKLCLSVNEPRGVPGQGLLGHRVSEVLSSQDIGFGSVRSPCELSTRFLHVRSWILKLQTVSGRVREFEFSQFQGCHGDSERIRTRIGITKLSLGTKTTYRASGVICIPNSELMRKRGLLHTRLRGVNGCK